MKNVNFFGVIMKSGTKYIYKLKISVSSILAFVLIIGGGSLASARVLVYMGSNFNNGKALATIQNNFNDNEVNGITAEGIEGTDGYFKYFSTVECINLNNNDETTYINPHTKYDLWEIGVAASNGNCTLDFSSISAGTWGWFDKSTITTADIRAGLDAGTLTPNTVDITLTNGDDPQIYVLPNTKIEFTNANHAANPWVIRFNSPTVVEAENPAGELGVIKDFVFKYDDNSNAGPSYATPASTLDATTCTGFGNESGDSSQAIYQTSTFTPANSGSHTFRTVLAHDSTTNSGIEKIRWNEGASFGRVVGWTDGLAFGGKGAFVIYSTFDPTDITTGVVGCSTENPAVTGDRNKTKTTFATEFSSQTSRDYPYIIGQTYPQLTQTLAAGTTYTLVYFPFTFNGKYVSQARFKTVKDFNNSNNETVRVEVWQPQSTNSGGSSSGESLKAATTCNSLTGTVMFKANSAKLDKTAKSKLNTYAQAVKDSGCKAVTLKGYVATSTDQTNTAKTTQPSRSIKNYRENLANQRNVAVSKYLESRFKTIGGTVTIKKQTLGEKNPVASNKTEKGRSKNRRVEIHLAG